MMNLDDIKQILDLVREHDLAELEIERDGLKVRIRKASAEPAAQHLVMVPPTMPVPAQPAAAPASAAASAPAAAPEPAAAEGVELGVVKSPIVGTVYRSSEPGAPPFVSVGSVVKKGQVLCIIEAMKLMNEIESDRDGEIASIYVENGQPVQFGDRLFAINPGKHLT
jgi:acetyl-CoA carboxylase biotin carboxyl carrier protein